MAVARTGSVTTFTSVNRSDNTTVSAPSDATLVVVAVSGFGVTASCFSTGTITWAGSAMSVGQANDSSGALEQTCVFYLVNPTTGSQTLSYTWAGSGAMTLGAHVYIAFYNGLNTSSPIRSNDGQAATGTATATTGSMSAQSGDLAACIGHAANTGLPATSLTWTNANQVTSSTFNGEFSGYAEDSPSGNVTISVQQGGGTAVFYTNISVIMIAASGATVDQESPAFVSQLASSGGMIGLQWK